MRSLDEFATAKLGELDRNSLRRELVETSRVTGVWTLRNRRRLLSFCCNDYLNLTHHPAVVEAASEALRMYGVGAGASRLVTGNHPLYPELEKRLARLKGTQAACVFGSGYLANLGIIPALVGSGDLVLIDELAHACLWGGSRLSRATVIAFRHSDLGHVEALLTELRRRYDHVLIATDGVFSMDGDIAPLHGLAAIAEHYDAWLLVDDAHGLGVVGGGRGTSFVRGRKAEIPLKMGTLSKAIGAYGGYICASSAVIDLLRNRARTLIYSTGLPPAIVAAAIAALDVIEQQPDYAALPVAKARAFARRAWLPEPQSPIVPVILGTSEAALAASALLEENGFLVTAIRPPTVPPGTARLRFTFTAQHPDEDIERLADLVRTRILARSEPVAMPAQ
jgi:8-amino-7-oxononanoate synthase